MARLGQILSSRNVITIIVIVLIAVSPDLRDTVTSLLPDAVESEELIYVLLGLLGINFRVNTKARL